MLTVAESLKPEWEEFLTEKGICPECETERYVFPRGPELVCLNCGLVLKRIYSPLERCSGFGNDYGRHDAPVNKLCFGSDLGNPAISPSFSSKALCRVIVPNGKENLGIRAIKLRNEAMRSQEDTITQRIKSYLSQWCKQYGWQDQHLLSNSLGYSAEWLGTILEKMKNGKNSKEFARAIFFINIKKFFGEKKASEVAEKLKVKPEFIEKARSLLKLDKLVV